MGVKETINDPAYWQNASSALVRLQYKPDDQNTPASLSGLLGGYWYIVATDGLAPCFAFSFRPDHCSVIINGTTTARQGLAQAAAYAGEGDQGFDCVLPGLHIGIARHILGTMNRVQSVQGKAMIVTGHSYGAALAGALCNQRNEPGLESQGPTGALLLGCPRFVSGLGSNAFSNAYLLRIARPLDVVQWLPPINPFVADAFASFAAAAIPEYAKWRWPPADYIVLKDNGFDRPGTPDAKGFPDVGAIVLWQLGAEPDPFEEHYILGYATRFNNIASPQRGVVPAQPLIIKDDARPIDAQNRLPHPPPGAVAAIADSIPSPLGRSGFTMPQFGKNVRPTVHAIGGTYSVQWMGRQVMIANTRSQGLIFAKKIIQALARCYKCFDVNEGNMAASISDWLTGAAAGDAGFPGPMP